MQGTYHLDIATSSTCAQCMPQLTWPVALPAQVHVLQAGNGRQCRQVLRLGANQLHRCQLRQRLMLQQLRCKHAAVGFKVEMEEGQARRPPLQQPRRGCRELETAAVDGATGAGAAAPEMAPRPDAEGRRECCIDQGFEAPAYQAHCEAAGWARMGQGDGRHEG